MYQMYTYTNTFYTKQSQRLLILVDTFIAGYVTLVPVCFPTLNALPTVVYLDQLCSFSQKQKKKIPC